MLRLLAAAGGAEAFHVRPLAPLGGEVHGLELRERPAEPVLARLEAEIAARGFLVVPGLHGLSSEELVNVSSYFGGRRVLGRHAVHPEAAHEDVLRLSNREEHGIQNVGGQWHSDGSFERRVFSHVLFHPQVIPQAGGETEIADLSAAYASLPQDVRLEWASLASVNAYSGAVHPLVHLHPVSRRPVMFLHLGQTGAVIRWPAESRPAGSAACRDWSSLEAMDPAAGQGLAEAGLRLLNETELVSLLGRYNELLSRSEHHIRYRYRPGDLLILDNLAVAHRASQSAHSTAGGTRILHRTTVAGVRPVDAGPSSGLPPFLHIFGATPFQDGGVWQSSDYYGAGFKWNRTLLLRN